MSAKSTAVQVLNTRAGMVAVGVAAVAIVLYLAARKAADVVVAKAPNLYDAEKKDRLLFGFINLDEPFAASKRLACSLPFVNCEKKSAALLPPDDTAQIVADASRTGTIH